MNTNQEAKRVLVYGDSLPWGLISGSKSFERFLVNERWPGRLQFLLGTQYEVIEECLCARTIDADDKRPGFEGRSGTEYLVPCLDSHDPVDVVLVSLGLNEVKSIFTFTPQEVAEKVKDLLLLVQNRKPNFHEFTPKIILVAPPAINEERASSFWGELWNGAGEKSQKLGQEFKKVAAGLEIGFVDLSEFVTPGVDGVHLDKDSHEIIANELTKIIKAL